jgi:hypothetical protein
VQKELKPREKTMGGSSSRSEIVNMTNDMVATIFTNIALSCNGETMSTQTTDINCLPPVTNPPPQNVYELNSGCQKCFNDIVVSQQEYYNFQRELWAAGEQNPSVKKPIDQDYQNVIAEFIACTANCKACNVSNVSQKTTISSVINCTSFNTVKNNIDQQLVASITQNLTNNQDGLSPIATMLGTTSTQDVVTNLTNRISSKITDTVIANVSQQISASQTLNIMAGSTNINGVQQQSAYSSITTYLQKTNIFNTIFSEEQWTVLQTLLNDQNTLGDLGNVVVKGATYIEKMLTNSVGKVVLFVLIMVGVVIAGVVLYVISQLIRNAVQKQKEKDLHMEHVAEEQPVFETF